MKRHLRWAAPLFLVGLTVAVHGQADLADYKGNKLCIACHKRTDAAIVDGFAETAHAKAMQEASDATIVADFANAPFAKDQVKYTFGAGNHAQAYLDADLKVLPGYWNVADKKWETLEAVDGATECVGCHTVGFNPETKEWKELGVGCESCHGVGKNHSTAKKEDRKTTILNPANFDPQHQAMACGQCHSGGRAKGGATAFAVGYVPGTDLDAVFDPGKPAPPGLNQQYSDLRQSPKHWDAGVVCEKCHEPHGGTDQPHQLRMAVNDTCLQCHKDKIKSLEEHTKEKNKTAPAGATCATCHMPNGRHLFDKTLADG